MSNINYLKQRIAEKSTKELVADQELYEGLQSKGVNDEIYLELVIQELDKRVQEYVDWSENYAERGLA